MDHPCSLPSVYHCTVAMCSGVRCHQVQLQWESSLRVKLQRAEKNLAAETKLEPCLNHTQNLPCHWTYSIVPTNNRLIFVLKKKPKHSYRYALITFGFETRCFWLWSLAVFSSAHFPPHSTFIHQTMHHFPSDKVFHNLFSKVSFRVEVKPVLGSHLIFFTDFGKCFSFRVSAFPSVRGGG